MLKRIFCFCLIALLYFLGGTAMFVETAVAAASGWVRVVDDSVCLYATAESSKVLFVLEKSYYLRILSEENGLYLVSVMENEGNFPQITGYVWKTEVELCDETPIAPYYPTVTLTVDGDSAQMKLTPTPSAETVLTVTNSQKVSYYGKISNYGEDWYYVYFCGKFGYVLTENLTAPSISLHPTPLTVEVITEPIQTDDTDDDEQNTSDETTTTDATEIILIIFVAALALGICLALFLPGNLKKKDVFDKDI